MTILLLSANRETFLETGAKLKRTENVLKFNLKKSLKKILFKMAVTGYVIKGVLCMDKSNKSNVFRAQ